MLIIPYVCAEFHDRKGTVLYRITPEMLRTLQEAPEAIEQDLLYGMLLRDGSIKTPETEARKKQLEKDPMFGINAEGKSVEAVGEESEAPAKAEKPDKPAKPAKAEKPESKPAAKPEAK